MRILLIDDEPLLLKSYARYLEVCMDQTVVTAPGGAEALTLLEGDEPFDMIFCDVSMRGVSGIDVHRAVCEHHPAMTNRFAFLTGGTTDAATGAYIGDSGVTVLSKPVDRAAFEKALSAASCG